MKSIEFDPAAEAELTDAATHYEDRVEGLGHRFFEEFEAVIELIHEWPTGFVRVDVPEAGGLQIRRAGLKRFPYSIVFIALKNTIRVLAVAHQKRRFLYWRNRVAQTPT